VAGVDPRDDLVGVRAARSVQLELWTILGEFRDAMTLVGGSAPPHIVDESPGDPYVGTLDVDVVIDPFEVPEETYRTIADLLRERGYEQTGQPFQWVREVQVDGRSVAVRVDLLAPVTDRRGQSHRHEEVGNIHARRAEGTELLRVQSTEVAVRGQLPDGRSNIVMIRFPTPGVLVILKALAVGQRDKPKDCYDIDFVLAHAIGGPDAVASQIVDLGDVEPVRQGLAVLRDKFDSVDSFGPQSVALYRRVALGSDEAARIQALAYARVQALLEVAGSSGDPGGAMKRHT
jgi:hypothetical protein